MDRPTPEQARAEPAGRSLDRWVAELAMGWRIGKVEQFHERDGGCPETVEYWFPEFGEHTGWKPSHNYAYLDKRIMFSPSQDMTAAMEVVAKLSGPEWEWNLSQDRDDTNIWWAERYRLKDWYTVSAKSSSLAHAIALAAVLIVVEGYP